MMFTTDLALKLDPIYAPISKRFHENPDQLAEAFAKAWYKLLHRDMGPVSRYLGPLVPSEPQLWQDPVPEVDHELIVPLARDGDGHGSIWIVSGSTSQGRSTPVSIVCLS